MTRFVVGLLAVLALVDTAPAVESWPDRPITFVVPTAAGGTPDMIARLLGEQLSPRLGQPIVIENHPGAGGLIGADYAAAAKPDGYTLFLGTIESQAILGNVHPEHKPNPTDAFAPVSLLGSISNVIAASPHLGITSFAAFLQAAHKGRAFTFATPGVGTSFHILGELIRIRENIQLTHVPYRIPSVGYTDVMAGRVDLVISGLPPVLPLIRQGKLVPLATTGARRSNDLPDTPTVAELGFNELTLANWFGLLVPVGTPQSIIAALDDKVRAIVKVDDYRRRMEASTIEPAATSPEEFGAMIKSEYARFGQIIERAKIVVK
jgi:tripartite-type tricarboxylate transporter receptor subunit TctC